MNVQRYVRMAHTSSVLVSLIVNGLLVAALFTFITFQEEQQREVNTVMVIDPTERQDIEEIEEELEPEEVEDPEDWDDLTDFTLDTPMDTDLDPSPEPVEETTQTDVSSLTDLMSDISSPVQMTGLLVGRSSAGRSQALKQYGRGLGGVSEPAVRKALEWLRDHQKPYGSWDKTGNTGGGKGNAGYTGLALLAYLAHGETPSSKEFGSTVAKGIRFLVENQSSSGVFQPAGGHTSYGHAIATYAIAEAYTLTDNVLLKEPLERGVQVIINGQQPQGGFDYGYKLSDRNDLSVGAWQVQALKAAKIALPEDAVIAERLERAMDGMLAGSGVGENGRSFRYTIKPGADPKPGNKKIISAAGTLGLHLTGRGGSREARQAIDFIEAFADRDRAPEWGENRIGGEYGGEIMFWYYAVQAFFQEDRTGSNFRGFYPPMVKALVQNQASDGHWDCFTERGAGQGPVFNTSLAALGLMVTYRYLPTTQAENIQAPPATRPALESLEDAVEFEI